MSLLALDRLGQHESRDVRTNDEQYEEGDSEHCPDYGIALMCADLLRQAVRIDAEVGIRVGVFRSQGLTERLQRIVRLFRCESKLF